MTTTASQTAAAADAAAAISAANSTATASHVRCSVEATSGCACASATFIDDPVEAPDQRQQRRARRTRRAANGHGSGRHPAARNGSISARDGGRLVVVEHVARIGDDLRACAPGTCAEPRAHAVETVGADLAVRDVRGRASADVRIGGRDPQHRRGDIACQMAKTSSIRYTVGNGSLWRGSDSSCARPSGSDVGPVRGEEHRLVARQPRIVLLQAVRDRGEARRTA